MNNDREWKMKWTEFSLEIDWIYLPKLKGNEEEWIRRTHCYGRLLLAGSRGYGGGGSIQGGRFYNLNKADGDD